MHVNLINGTIVTDTTSRKSALPTSGKTLAADQPPGPNGLPLVGCLNRVLRNPMTFFTDVATTYGGIARIPLGRDLVYLVSEPTLLYELLVTNRQKYKKNIRYRHARELVGQGMLLSEGEVWKRQRRITQPAFKVGYITEQIGWMADITSKFLDRWDTFAINGKPIDVEPEFVRLAQLLAGRFVLGPGFEAIAERLYGVSAEIKASWPKPPGNLISSLIKVRSKAKFTCFQSILKKLDDCVYQYISDERESDFEDSGILSRLVKSSCQEGQQFTEKELRDQLLTLFFAGHETSATAMCWIHYFLSENPSVRQKLRQEVESILGQRRPTYEDLEKLQYTEQIVQESLRIYSPIHAISRVAVEDNRIGGYLIPAGSTIYISLYATHHLPQYWQNPEGFDPERFTPKRCSMRSGFVYIPFAAGHRNCVGFNLATIELKMMIAQLAQRYELDLLPRHRIEPVAGTTMYPRNGMKMIVRKI